MMQAYLTIQTQQRNLDDECDRNVYFFNFAQTDPSLLLSIIKQLKLFTTTDTL